MEKFLVYDDDDEEIIETVGTELAALETANEFVTNTVDETPDGQTLTVGIYKLVKVITASRKVTRLVKAVK